MSKTQLWVTILIFIIFISSGTILPWKLASADTTMGPTPSLTISALNPYEAWAVVTATKAYQVNYTALVTVSKPPVGTVMVQLVGSTSTGWPTVVDPSQIPFTSSGSVKIAVAVTIPKATPVESIGVVTVNGVGTYAGFDPMSATSTGKAYVKQYFGAQLNAIPTRGTNNPQRYNISVQNIGNGADSYELSIPLLDVQKKAGFTMTFDRTTTDKIYINAVVYIDLTVNYGLGAQAGEREFYIRATSLGSVHGGNETIYCDFRLTIVVNPIYSQYGLSIGLIALAIIIVVAITLFVAKKKGKLVFKSRLKKAAKPEKSKPKEK